jgi:hypothetical protein
MVWGSEEKISLLTMLAPTETITHVVELLNQTIQRFWAARKYYRHRWAATRRTGSELYAGAHN